jgi:hypothetical protein
MSDINKMGGPISLGPAVSMAFVGQPEHEITTENLDSWSNFTIDTGKAFPLVKDHNSQDKLVAEALLFP